MTNRRVQLTTNKSVLDKRFRKLVPSRKRMDSKGQTKAHAAVVLLDLKRGCTKSLDLYLRQRGGIPDREVAVELRKLLSGGPGKSRYRLIAIEHPDGPPPKLGRPNRSISKPPTKRVQELAEAFRQEYQITGSADSAAAEVADINGVTERTVFRAHASCLRYEAEQAEMMVRRSELTARRFTALDKLRQKSPRT